MVFEFWKKVSKLMEAFMRRGCSGRSAAPELGVAAAQETSQETERQGDRYRDSGCKIMKVIAS